MIRLKRNAEFGVYGGCHMEQQRHREEVFNAQLAVLLVRHGVDAEAETIRQSGASRPDVIFTLGGLRVIIEGKFADVPNAEAVVLNDAQRRVDAGICHVAVALVYPAALRSIAAALIEETLSASQLRFLIISETGKTEWAESQPGEILSALRRVHESLIKDDIVAKSAIKLSERIETIAALWLGQGAVCDRLSILLGMPLHSEETTDEKEAWRATATKVASLVLANAMIFQEQLAISGDDSRIESLRSFDRASDPVEKLRDYWNRIWSEINYVPIFQLGESILTALPVSPSAINAIRGLIEEAKSICLNQSALRHDLMGRIYHWLLYHAKYLGTYYTATSSATLLLKLAFSRDWQGRDFGSTESFTDFVVSDLACGTGTLLMAAAQAITDQFVVSRARTERTLTGSELGDLHKTLMENVLWGYDVLPTAVHLTASTLGMLAPHVTYKKMNLFIMPLGVDDIGKKHPKRLGSLDFISSNKVTTQMALDARAMEVRRTGVASEHSSVAEIPTLDLCVMNPPFVRSVGGNLLFGSLPDKERTKLQDELKRMTANLPASITAGLGSVFMAIADKYLREGGRIAFILPVALATGEAWVANRKLITEKYHLETVIVSHDAEKPNFSENTDLSELMFIARKLRRGEAAGDTVYVNLWHNPRTIYEALDIANRVSERMANGLNCTGTASIHSTGGRKLAEIVQLPAKANGSQWTGVQFAQAPTLKAAVSLGQGRLEVPGQTPVDVPLCPLSDMGAIGYDRRDIHDAFTVSRTDWSPYSAFWNHESKTVTCIRQKPNSWLIPRTVPAKGRPLKSASQVANSVGRILLIERLGSIYHRVIAIRLDEPVLGNTWWAFKSELSEKQEKALLLWLNSTPSLLLTLARRVTTNGAWVQVKKPQWSAMPVLNVRSLPAKTLTKLAAAYDKLCGQELQALAKLDTDPARAGIDNALSLALGLPDMKTLRQLLAREPGLTGKPPADMPAAIRK